MKSYIFLLLFALALASVPLASAGQAPDPQLQTAHDQLAVAFECFPPPYVSVDCVTLAGGTVVTTFAKSFGAPIIAQALRDGSSKEWTVDAFSCALNEGGSFASMSQGFHPWKNDLLDFCNACVDNSSCLSLVP